MMGSNLFDAHLIAPTHKHKDSDTKEAHIYYLNPKDKNYDSSLAINLDIDKGKNVITINEPTQGKYYLYIHDYVFKQKKASVSNIAKSNITIKVYREGYNGKKLIGEPICFC